MGFEFTDIAAGDTIMNKPLPPESRLQSSVDIARPRVDLAVELIRVFRDLDDSQQKLVLQFAQSLRRPAKPPSGPSS